MLRRGNHDQRVGGRLAESRRPHLPALHVAHHALQIRLHLRGDLTGVQHFQVVRLDIEAALVLRVDLGHVLLNLLELLERRANDQLVVVDRDVNLLGLALPATHAAAVEVVEHVPRFPGVGVLELDDDDVVIVYV